MAIKISDWERPLLTLAYEATQSNSSGPALQLADNEALALAYDYCEEITAINSRSFLYGLAFPSQE